MWTSRITDARGDETIAGPAATACGPGNGGRPTPGSSAITGADDPATLQRQLESKLRAAAAPPPTWRPHLPGSPWPSDLPTPNAAR